MSHRLSTAWRWQRCPPESSSTPISVLHPPPVKHSGLNSSYHLHHLFCFWALPAHRFHTSPSFQLLTCCDSLHPTPALTLRAFALPVGDPLASQFLGSSSMISSAAPPQPPIPTALSYWSYRLHVATEKYDWSEVGCAVSLNRHQISDLVGKIYKLSLIIFILITSWNNILGIFY